MFIVLSPFGRLIKHIYHMHRKGQQLICEYIFTFRRKSGLSGFMSDNYTDPILAEILLFCEKHGMKVSTFSQLATNDRALVKTLRSGRELRRKTLVKVRKFMVDYVPE